MIDKKQSVSSGMKRLKAVKPIRPQRLRDRRDAAGDIKVDVVGITCDLVGAVDDGDGGGGFDVNEGAATKRKHVAGRSVTFLQSVKGCSA